ncbi:hypothetical protein Tco_0362697 [Tanacetum coccineum]
MSMVDSDHSSFLDALDFSTGQIFLWSLWDFAILILCRGNEDLTLRGLFATLAVLAFSLRGQVAITLVLNALFSNLRPISGEFEKESFSLKTDGFGIRPIEHLVVDNRSFIKLMFHWLSLAVLDVFFNSLIAMFLSCI